MTLIRPFCSIRPNSQAASHVAALPYDVYNRQEAKAEVGREPLSFLNIDRAETQFPECVDTYAPEVYQKASELLNRWIKEGIFVVEQRPCYYLYELTMGNHVQTGIVACSSVDDYISGVVKKHENTRENKELDRIRHVDVTNAQTGPIFLAYRSRERLRVLTAEVKRDEALLLYDFVSPDGVRHRVFRIDDRERINLVTEEFSRIPGTYIADGHHRAASAVKVALKRREEHPGYTGEEEFNYFLSVLFPEEELQILPYNRVVSDLNGLSEEEFLQAAQETFEVRKVGTPAENAAVCPEEKGIFGLLLKSGWYELRLKEELRPEDPVGALDVSVLQELLLGPVLGIQDPRTDRRIAFIGGIRGTGELERLVNRGGMTSAGMALDGTASSGAEPARMAAAFSMYPTSMEELLSVADAGLLMPPKSTWFEPKLRSGLFIHRL